MNNRLDAAVVGDRSISMDRPTWDMRKTVTLYRMEAPLSILFMDVNGLRLILDCDCMIVLQVRRCISASGTSVAVDRLNEVLVKD